MNWVEADTVARAIRERYEFSPPWCLALAILSLCRDDLTRISQSLREPTDWTPE